MRQRLALLVLVAACGGGSSATPDARVDGPSTVCGNGVVESDELCDTGIAAGSDGACPTSCDDGSSCTTDVATGADCSASCTHTTITMTAAGDGCCPAGANMTTDSDCAAVCGNGVLEGGEVCDTGIASGTTACPSSCSDSDACTSNALASPGTCLASCPFTPITAAANSDGCCPPGITGATDNDCPPTKLDVMVDKTAISTELKTSHMITVTMTASQGFSGAVTLAGTLVDASDNAFTGWTIMLDQTSFNLAADGTATAHATVTIPSTNAGLFAKAKFVATSSAMAGTTMASTDITAENRVTIDLPVVSNQCVYPAAGTLQLSVGTTIRWFNSSAADSWIIHTDTAAYGVPHQSSASPTAPGALYEATISMADGGTFSWDCHSPGPNVNDRLIQPVP